MGNARIPLMMMGLCLGPLACEMRAALIDLGGGMIYDSTLDITWLQDANLARTTGHATSLYGTNTDGQMTWPDAMAWADGLTVAGATNWRLPSALDINGSGPSQWTPDTEFTRLHAYGVDCYHYAWNDFADHSGPFDNIPNHAGYYASVSYWTSTASDLDNAWAYCFSGPGMWARYQGANSKQLLAYAWAVHDGAVQVPEPGTLSLLAVGLYALWIRRRRASCGPHDHLRI